MAAAPVPPVDDHLDDGDFIETCLNFVNRPSEVDAKRLIGAIRFRARTFTMASTADDAGAGASTDVVPPQFTQQGLSQYELKREARIQRNKAVLAELGLASEGGPCHRPCSRSSDSATDEEFVPSSESGD